MLMAIYALNQDAKEGILLYAVAYSLATIGIFSVLGKMNDYTFEGFNGLAKQQPLIAAALVVFLLSLAGIPLTAGFLAKFYMLKAVVATGSYLWLAVFGVLMAAVSVYYYFRVIQAMYFKEGPATIEAGRSYKMALIVLAALIIIIGIMPEWLFYWLYF
jgi:NADH-quinone oxidoreductase subunit N